MRELRTQPPVRKPSSFPLSRLLGLGALSRATQGGMLAPEEISLIRHATCCSSAGLIASCCAVPSRGTFDSTCVLPLCVTSPAATRLRPQPRTTGWRAQARIVACTVAASRHRPRILARFWSAAASRAHTRTFRPVPLTLSASASASASAGLASVDSGRGAASRRCLEAKPAQRMLRCAGTTHRQPRCHARLCAAAAAGAVPKSTA